MKDNPHQIGIVMKELVRRAIEAIRSRRIVFEVEAKPDDNGEMKDMYTTADTAAQLVYVKGLRECYPGYGIIGEEEKLRIQCSDGSRRFFTVDPLDGTKAFIRRQSHGIGSMISLSEGKKFLAAFVGDVNTHEIYGFRPGSSKVHRISEYSASQSLVAPDKLLRDQYILLRDPHTDYSKLSQRIILKKFKSNMVDGSSIGIWMARLWKGEVGGLLLLPTIEKPWDANPVNAITRQLGYVYLRPAADGKGWEQYTPLPATKDMDRQYETLIIHRKNLPEIIKTAKR